MHTVLQVDGHDRAGLNQGRITCRRNSQSGSSPSCSCQCDISNREGWEMGANRYSHPQQRPEFTHSFHRNERTCTPGRWGGHSHNQLPELSQSNESTGGPSEPPLGLHNEKDTHHLCRVLAKNVQPHWTRGNNQTNTDQGTGQKASSLDS